MRHADYSYRSDPAVPDFDDSDPLVIFDGECVLCSGGINFMLENDRKGTTKFAVIQDPVPRALYGHYGLDADAFDTFMVLDEGKAWLRWAGACKAARLMPAPWKWLGQVGRLVPGFIGNRIYDFVQRHRISWFGERSACYRPTPQEQSRFLTPA